MFDLGVEPEFPIPMASRCVPLPGTVDGVKVVDGLSIHQRQDADWFSFQLEQVGSKDDAVRIVFDQSLGDLDLNVLTSESKRLVSETAGSVEYVSLNGLPAGLYQVHVFGRREGFGGEALESNPNYTLLIQAGTTAAGDWAEKHGIETSNNERSRAYDLREIDGEQLWSGLSIHSDADRDWFQFQLVQPGVIGHRLGIAFDQTRGDLDLHLYDMNGNLLVDRSAATHRSVEEVSLASLPAGTYYAEVRGWKGAANPQYSLFINAASNHRGPDWTEPSTSTDLHVVEGLNTWAGLSLHADTIISSNGDVTDFQGEFDVFVFELTAPGKEGDYVSIVFDHSAGT